MAEAKHRIKRGFAYISFASILLVLFTLVATWFWGNEETAENIQASSGIIIMILACLTTIVLGYLGLSHHADIKKKE